MKKVLLLAFLAIAPLITPAQLMIHVGDKINNDITVTAVDDDNEYFWVGTSKGLYRVNKSDKKDVLFTEENSPLRSNYITAVCCRKNGDVWIGTAKGALFYDGYAFNTVDTDNSQLPENKITSMQEDVTGDLWIGTKTCGLVKVHRNRFYLYNKENSNLQDNTICSIIRDKQQNLVITGVHQDSVLASNIVRK